MGSAKPSLLGAGGGSLPRRRLRSGGVRVTMVHQQIAAAGKRNMITGGGRVSICCSLNASQAHISMRRKAVQWNQQQTMRNFRAPRRVERRIGSFLGEGGGLVALWRKIMRDTLRTLCKIRKLTNEEGGGRRTLNRGARKWGRPTGRPFESGRFNHGDWGERKPLLHQHATYRRVETLPGTFGR